jgi:hypothetical protein
MNGWDITVTWMDGKQEIYRAQDCRVTEGELVLTGEDGSYASRDTTRHLPLASIRIWKGERR